MNLAFFDVDYTLYKGFTVVQFFRTFTQNNGRQDLLDERNQLEAEVAAGTLDHQKLVEWSMSLAARAVDGFTIEKVQQQILATIKEEGEFFPWVEPVLDFLRHKQFSIYLISASIEPMIAEIARLLKIDHYFATILEQVDGMYTGKVVTVRNGHSKLETLNQVISSISQSEKHNVIAFGDSDGDVAMLKAADLGFVVDPVEYSDEIFAGAKKYGWPILKHETAEVQIKQALKEKFSL